MARVVIVPSLEEEINKRFKGESVRVFELLRTLSDNPKKGKELGHVGRIVVKELKYGVYRFYFLTDGHSVKFLKADELKNLLVTFVRMSDKDRQAETIEEIKIVLRKVGDGGFE